MIGVDQPDLLTRHDSYLPRRVSVLGEVDGVQTRVEWASWTVDEASPLLGPVLSVLTARELYAARRAATPDPED